MGGTVGKKVKEGKHTEANGSPITINLFGPGMTALHKVGLAGLWMTLEALEGDPYALDACEKLTVPGNVQRHLSPYIGTGTRSPSLRRYLRSRLKSTGTVPYGSLL